MATGLSLLYHPDPTRIGERVLLPEPDQGEEVLLSRRRPDFAAPRGGEPRPLADPRLSRRDWILSSGPDGILVRRAGSPTSMVVDGRPIADEVVVDRAELEAGVVLLFGGRTVLLLHRIGLVADGGDPGYGLIGESSAMVELRRNVTRVVDLDVPVLLRGATGTGKELVALALHEHGPRASGPLVVVNMAAIPPSLAAADLFGAVKGAYTGAERSRDGYFRKAQGGTLFLDEIGETPAEVQPLLLRALDSGEIQPVGSQDRRKVDVRVISATDSDLETMVEAGEFRAPLLHRLRSFQLTLPSLDQRRDDLGRLLISFLREELRGIGRQDLLDADREPWLPGAVVAYLAGCAWPGNVRQLRNVARQLVIANRDRDPARLDATTAALLNPPPEAWVEEPVASAVPSGEPLPRRAAEVGQQELEAALRAHRWQPHAAAHALGIPRASIYDLIAKSPFLRTAADLDRREVEAARTRHDGDVAAMAEELKVSERALRRRMGELGLS